MLAEKDMEDAIARDPERYLGEPGLELVERQYPIGEYRFDLLFSDRHGARLIVEIQRGTLDRNHTYKILDYYDAFHEKHPDQYIELMVVANRIPVERKKRLTASGVAFREIPEAAFISHGNMAFSPPAPSAQGVKSITRDTANELPAKGSQDLTRCDAHRHSHEAHVAKAGVTTNDGSVLEDASPLALAKAWLQRNHMRDGERLLHFVNGDYYRWDNGVYRKASIEEIKCEWYDFFGGVQRKKDTADGGVKISGIIADRKFIRNIHDAASSHLFVRLEDGVHEPFSIRARAPMDLARAVIFQNGILYIEGGHLAPLTPDVFVTSTLPYEYRPGSACPLWLWFIEDIFDGDQECIALLQEWFGYNLIASNHMQSMMFFFGVPGSGKSTTAGVLESLLGRVRCCGASTNNFRTLFGKEALLNKHAAIMSESRDTAKRDIDQLLQTWKALTGGDLMNIARKYKQAVDVSLFCRLTYVANEAIPFDDASQAMASRMNLLYFGKNYRKQNPDRELSHTLKAELPGVALWAIEGLKRLLANNRFTLPERSKAELAKIADLTNPVGAMLDECVERFIGAGYADHRVECGQMYDLWKGWCDVNMSRTSLSQIGFGMKLAHLENPIKAKQIMEAGRRIRVYPGVAIRPEAADRYLKK